MTLYTYYKNVIFIFEQFLFSINNGLCGQTLCDSNYISFFNTLFTTWALLVRATFDHDLNYKKWTSSPMLKSKTLTTIKMLKRFYPYLYHVGQKNQSLKGNNKLLHIYNLVVEWSCNEYIYLAWYEFCNWILYNGFIWNSNWYLEFWGYYFHFCFVVRLLESRYQVIDL